MTLADQARRLVEARFVGRAGERARFEALLLSGEPAVVWVFGQGGIGKSSLLAMFAHIAEAAGVPAAVVDLRQVESPRLALPGLLASTTDHTRQVVLIDAFERIEDLEDWVLGDLVPGLPSGSIVVVGGRRAPSPDWRADPAWSALLHLVPLRELGARDASALLELGGVGPAARPSAIQLAGGHPLALSLLAQYLRGSDTAGVPEDLREAPDLVATLLSRLVEGLDEPAHRRALEIAGLARVTTRDLLRHALGDELGNDSYAWLEAQPSMDRVRDGVCPHDLVREVLQADLRRSDPERYVEVHRQIRTFLLEPDGLRHHGYARSLDFVYLHRANSRLGGAWDWSTFGNTEVGTATPDELDLVVTLVESKHGPAAAAIARHWTSRQPRATLVARSPAGVPLGFVMTLTLVAPSPQDLAVDPAVAAVWADAQRRGVPREGEVIGVCRFFEDAVDGQRVPTPTSNVVTVESTRRWVGLSGIALDYVYVREPKTWAPMMEYVDFAPLPTADVVIDGLRASAYFHDWRVVTPADWLERMEALELGGTPPDRTEGPVLVALGRDDFAHAVRVALKDLARPDRLAESPLRRARVVHDTGGEAGDAVERTIRAAWAQVVVTPRTERARRALERTYLHGEVSQEAAAEVLGLPFSTYRRQLTMGIGLLVDQLWRWELFGREK